MQERFVCLENQHFQLYILSGVEDVISRIGQKYASTSIEKDGNGRN